MNEKDKEAKIAELNEKRSKLIKEANKLSDEIQELEFQDYNYTGKYIYDSNYDRYMYVTSQRVRDSREIIFQGFTFSSEINDQYIDDFGISVSGLSNWNFRKDIFESMIKANELYPITKEYFISKLHDNLSIINMRFENILEDWIKSVKKDKN